MTSAAGEPSVELVDLRGQPSPEQIAAAQRAVERASEAAITVVSELEVIPKFLLPAAAERGLHCRMEPPQPGEWRVTLRPRAETGDARANKETTDG